MTSPEDGSARLQSRAYQLEMFNHSLKSNTIVVMDTGTGKTHIASLRIDAELRRTPHKQVWFTAPNAELVDQQLRFLSMELPEYRMRSLTGRDNVDAWTNAVIWEAILRDINVVVATPQVLLDALGHAYVRLQDISLLVFDEAHHCQKGSPSALIMLKFYHPQKRLTGTVDLPHILGLTASPCISDKSASVEQLEANLGAKCRSPTISIDQYAQHVHKAELVRIHFTHIPQEPSDLLRTLESIVQATTLSDDPEYLCLVAATAEGDEVAVQKLRKCEEKGQTPAMTELRKFLGNAQHLHEALGIWACDLYISTCVTHFHRVASEVNAYHVAESSHRQKFIKERLVPLGETMTRCKLPSDPQLSRKAVMLIQYLVSQYTEDIAVIVFVERRCVAWALRQLLQTNPSLGRYGIFSCVGSSNAKYASLDNIYTTETQHLTFLQFKQGLRNLCIATSVAEEGLDMQAVNVVIRYDDPKQLVSYVQSRGRARKKDSKMVCFQDINGPPGKYEGWDKFERAMKEQYRKEKDELLKRLEVENRKEESDEMYHIKSTGARLDLDISVSHLAHFCAKTVPLGGPIYLLNGDTGVAVSAKVLLPSHVPPLLREAHSCQTWRSEKMAKRDAAFHAMKALHIAGLVNDHLMPFEEHETLVPLAHEKKLREVPAEHQVWMASDSEARPFAYRIQVSHSQDRYLSMVMILSTPLHQMLRFPLWETPLRKVEVTVVPLGQVDSLDAISAADMTKLLFEAAFQVGSASNSLRDPSRLSCTILPEFDDTHLGTDSAGLGDFLNHHGWLRDLQPLLIWRKARPRPYIWYPPHVIRRSPNGEYTVTAKQIRKLQILSKTFGTEIGKACMPQDKELFLVDCEARGIVTVYGPIVLLLPSILHLMAAALRAQYANQTILRSIGFSSAELIVPALIANSASGTYNYERLEFLGDACLKYLASVQMFFDHPLAPEGILTRKTHEIIGNSRLEEAFNDIGLAPFITTETPVQKHWKMPKINATSEVLATRSVLSKTLADVVESILGAAFLDGKQNGSSIKQCITTLQLFIPEIKWRSPKTHINQNGERSIQDTQESLLQYPIKQMLGCQFENPKLLMEALTHSTDLVSQPALDRLEFLGDAVLDQIIKMKLFEHRDLDAGRLTLCRHALASHAYLAYRALSIHYDEVLQGIPVYQNGELRPVNETRKVELTDLIKFREAQLRDPIVISKTRYDAIKDSIEAELKASRFPWTLLRSLSAPKVCSDIIESLLGALYLDSKGSLGRCEKLLERLGMIDLLEQMAKNDNFEVRTPGTKLRELCAEKKIAVSIRSRCQQERNISRYIGEIRLEGDVCIVREASCLEEAKSLVAEAAMQFLLVLQKPQFVESRSDGIDAAMSGV